MRRPTTRPPVRAADSNTRDPGPIRPSGPVYDNPVHGPESHWQPTLASVGMRLTTRRELLQPKHLQVLRGRFNGDDAVEGACPGPSMPCPCRRRRWGQGFRVGKRLSSDAWGNPGANGQIRPLVNY